MDVESPQRLIAVSLGKIAASRCQRGGPSLHKSLLVSAVLHKARTQVMMDNFHAMLEARRTHEMESNNPYSTLRTVPDISDSSLCLDIPPIVSSLPSQDKTNGLSYNTYSPITHYSSEDHNNRNSQNNYDFKSDYSCSSYLTEEPSVLNCTGDSSQHVVSYSHITQLTCPLTDSHDNNDDVEEVTLTDISQSSCINYNTTKRRCYDNDYEKPHKKLKPEYISDSYTPYNSCDLYNQNCDTSSHHLSHLVKKFNTGFTGLLNQSPYYAYSCDTDSYSCSDMSSIPSCATQVSAAFEPLSRTCIALSVS